MPEIFRICLLGACGIYLLFQTIWVLSGARLSNSLPEDLLNPAYLMGVVVGCAFGLCLGCTVFVAQIRYLVSPNARPRPVTGLVSSSLYSLLTPSHPDALLRTALSQSFVADGPHPVPFLPRYPVRATWDGYAGRRRRCLSRP